MALRPVRDAEQRAPRDPTNGMHRWADGPFRDGKVDEPRGSHRQVALQHSGSEQRAADPSRERLRTRGQADRVRPDHPGAVLHDVAATDGRDAEDQADGHPGGEHQAQHVEQRAGSGFRRVEKRHPDRRAGDEQARNGQDPAGTAVPAEVVAAEPRHELEGSDDQERAGAGDVGHQGKREAREPVVGRDQLRPAEQLDHPEQAGQDRDDAQHQQGRWHGPAPPCSLPGRAPRQARRPMSGHQTVA